MAASARTDTWPTRWHTCTLTSGTRTLGLLWPCPQPCVRPNVRARAYALHGVSYPGVCTHKRRSTRRKHTHSDVGTCTCGLCGPVPTWPPRSPQRTRHCRQPMTTLRAWWAVAPNQLGGRMEQRHGDVSLGELRLRGQLRCPRPPWHWGVLQPLSLPAQLQGPHTDRSPVSSGTLPSPRPGEFLHTGPACRLLPWGDHRPLLAAPTVLGLVTQRPYRSGSLPQGLPREAPTRPWPSASAGKGDPASSHRPCLWRRRCWPPAGTGGPCSSRLRLSPRKPRSQPVGPCPRSQHTQLLGQPTSSVLPQVRLGGLGGHTAGAH